MAQSFLLLTWHLKIALYKTLFIYLWLNQRCLCTLGYFFYIYFFNSFLICCFLRQIKWFSILDFSWVIHRFWSPWYNHTGWLGVKHQPTHRFWMYCAVLCSHALSCMHLCMNTHAPTHVHIIMQVHMYAYTYSCTHMQAYNETYAHTCVCTLLLSLSVFTLIWLYWLAGRKTPSYLLTELLSPETNRINASVRVKSKCSNSAPFVTVHYKLLIKVWKIITRTAEIQLHRVSSGQSNSVISKHTLQTFYCKFFRNLKSPHTQI